MKITAPVTDYIRASVMSVQGDLVIRGAMVPERLAVGTTGEVLTSQGLVQIPIYRPLFDRVTTKGDMWVRDETWVIRLAAGALDTYLKAQGDGELPIYEKLALRDTGIKIGTGTRNASGSQVIADVGFKASVLIFFAISEDSGIGLLSWGFDDGTTHYCVCITNDFGEVHILTTHSIDIRAGVGSYIRGYVSTISDIGFTIEWVKLIAGDAIFIYLALP